MNSVPDKTDIFGLIIRLLKQVSHKAYHGVQDVDEQAITLCEPEGHGGCLADDGLLDVQSFFLVPLELTEDVVHVSGSS